MPLFLSEKLTEEGLRLELRVCRLSNNSLTYRQPYSHFCPFSFHGIDSSAAGYIAPELLEALIGDVAESPLTADDFLDTVMGDIHVHEMDRASPSVDVYGVGMILYELLERRRPYNEHNSPAAVSRQILNQKVL